MALREQLAAGSAPSQEAFSRLWKKGGTYQDGLGRPDRRRHGKTETAGIRYGRMGAALVAATSKDIR
jgi:hypothetical protein